MAGAWFIHWPVHGLYGPVKPDASDVISEAWFYVATYFPIF